MCLSLLQVLFTKTLVNNLADCMPDVSTSLTLYFIVFANLGSERASSLRSLDPGVLGTCSTVLYWSPLTGL